MSWKCSNTVIFHGATIFLAGIYEPETYAHPHCFQYLHIIGMLHTIFVWPGQLPIADAPNTVYIGDLSQRNQYPEESPVQMFVSLSAYTPCIAPLLLLSEVPEIQVSTSPGCRPITIQAAAVLPDIEERIDDTLRETVPAGICIYQHILGGLVSVSDHDCREHFFTPPIV